MELMLAKAGSWIFKPGETPRVLWRDVETVRRLGCDEPLRVRWFNAELEESPEPDASGRCAGYAREVGYEPLEASVTWHPLASTHRYLSKLKNWRRELRSRSISVF